MWYLIVSIPDLCTLTYIVGNHMLQLKSNVPTHLVLIACMSICSLIRFFSGGIHACREAVNLVTRMSLLNDLKRVILYIN